MKYRKLQFFLVLLAISCWLLVTPAVLAATSSPVTGQSSNQNQGSEDVQAAQKEGTDFTNTFLDSAGFNVLKTSEGQDVRLYVVALIKMVLSFTGFLFLVLVVYGGYLWMTAGGNEETLTKARQIIGKAIVGFVVIMAAYSLTVFVGWYIGQSIAGASQEQKGDFLQGLGGEIEKAGENPANQNMK